MFNVCGWYSIRFARINCGWRNYIERHDDSMDIYDVRPELLVFFFEGSIHAFFTHHYIELKFFKFGICRGYCFNVSPQLRTNNKYQHRNENLNKIGTNDDSLNLLNLHFDWLMIYNCSYLSHWLSHHCLLLYFIEFCFVLILSNNQISSFPIFFLIVCQR